MGVPGAKHLRIGHESLQGVWRREGRPLLEILGALEQVVTALIAIELKLNRSRGQPLNVERNRGLRTASTDPRNH